MKNNWIVFSSCVLLVALLLSGCKANHEDFGHERVYLSQAMVITPVVSPYFSDAGASESEPATMAVCVAGVTRSGEMLDPADVTVEYEIESGYLDAQIAKLQDSSVEMTDELAFLKDNKADILPAECYEIGSLRIGIPSDKTLGVLSVTLKLDKVKELDLEKSWFLPSFRIKTASIAINRVRERSLVGLKFSTK